MAGQVSSRLFAFDLQLTTWREIVNPGGGTPWPSARSQLGCLVRNGAFLIFGGSSR